MAKLLLNALLVASAVFVAADPALASPDRSSGLLAATPAKRADPEIPGDAVTVRDARQLDGHRVRVSGTVTVQSGAFASSISSGFAIQDDTAGIYVIDDTLSYRLGQRVAVAGTVRTENKQLVIELEDTTLLSGDGIVAPRPVKTGSVGDAEGGYLISAGGRITRTIDDGQYGYKLFIDDGSGPYQVFINASTELFQHAASWKPGDVIRVVGFAGRYNDVYEIMPRILSDIERVAIDPSTEDDDDRARPLPTQ